MKAEISGLNAMMEQLQQETINLANDLKICKS